VPKPENEEYYRSFCYTHRIRPDADIYFVTNPFDEKLETFGFAAKDHIPQLWDAYTGKIQQTDDYVQKGDSVFVTLNLEKDHSMFVIMQNAECKMQNVETRRVASLQQTAQKMDGAWDVTFYPKLDRPFKKKLPELIDFSKQNDEKLKYFSGTAVYENKFKCKMQNVKCKMILDLGAVHDMATVEINGNEIGVLWFPPFQIDITDYVKAGTNSLKISITNTWANRLIGDEQYPADFEWGTDRGKEGRAKKAFPEWFLRNEPRTEQGRKTFNLWYYYHKDSELQPAGLLGPVGIEM
jgi:hypothetical protein